MGRIRASFPAVAVTLAAALFGGIIGLRGDQPARPPVLASASVDPSGHDAPSHAAKTVHVSGAVVHPGLVEVPTGARVADAIRAAGGALPTADLSGLNLASHIGDGEQLVVPSVGASGPPPGGGTVEVGPISLNRATTEELMTLPGVGPVLAERIVAHRESIGAFSSIEDLLDVSGIGERKLAELRPLVRVP